jgi:shikimate kinase
MKNLPIKNIIDRPITLIGIMGAGKTTLGKRLAKKLNLEFFDSDLEIEDFAGCTIKTIFERQGEQAFRNIEQKVLAQLLSGSNRVIATGGGAFINPDTRLLIKEKTISIWLKTSLNLAMSRVEGRDKRPLLNNVDIRKKLDQIINQRNPIYAEADITIDSEDIPHDQMISRLLYAVAEYSGIQSRQMKTREPD